MVVYVEFLRKGISGASIRLGVSEKLEPRDQERSLDLSFEFVDAAHGE